MEKRRRRTGLKTLRSEVPITRSEIMRSVGRQDTAPEMAVRRALHAAGLRYRLHDRSLPGTPDIVMRKHRLAIFVHGCFWHRHEGCSRTTSPRSNAAYWQTKFDRNQQRDAEKSQALEAMGYRVIVVWECETRRADQLSAFVERVRSLLPTLVSRSPPG